VSFWEVECCELGSEEASRREATTRARHYYASASTASQARKPLQG